MRFLSISKIHYGHSLHDNIFSPEGQCLFKSGVKLEPAVLNKLTDMGYQTLAISDSQDSGIEPKPLVS